MIPQSLPPSVRTRGLDFQPEPGGETILSGIDLDLPAGRIYGLLGRNGAGKTTLMSLLAAYYRATAGEVLVGAVPVYENRSAVRTTCLVRGTDDIRDDLGKVSDLFHMAQQLRAGWDAAFEERLVERFELDPRKKLKELSQGDRAKVATILGMASRAPLTMLDECHLGMDSHVRQVFYNELIADYTENPRTLILSSHLIDELGPLFEDVVILHRGRVLLHENAEELRARGVAVTGPADRVQRFVQGADGMTALGEKRLSDTLQLTLFGELNAECRREAERTGLQLEPVGLQDLFVHLTTEQGARL